MQHRSINWSTRSVLTILMVLCLYIPTLAISINEYAIPSGGHPHRIVAGPDGNLWFLEGGVKSVGRLTPEGVFTEFSLPDPSSSAYEITAGPDGNLWFTIQIRFGEYRIGRITTAGVVTEFPLSNPREAPYGLIDGKNGSLWFLMGGRKICRLTTAGVMTEYPIPNSSQFGGTISGLAADKNGNVFCIQLRQSLPINSEYVLIKSTPDGVLTERSLGMLSSYLIAHLATGPDGHVWYSTQSRDLEVPGFPPLNGFRRADGDDSLSVPTGLLAPLFFNPAPDGSFWFLSSTGTHEIIGRATIDGRVSQYEIGGLNILNDLVAGPDGKIWLVEGSRNKILRLTPDDPTDAIVTRAASFVGGSVAPDSIATIFGNLLAPGVGAMTSSTLPASQAGISVIVMDSSGVERKAPTFFDSPSQINLLIPSGVSMGNATVKVVDQNEQIIKTGTMIIDDITPALFTADSTGRGLASGLALRVKADGTQTYEPIVRLDENNNLVSVPIDLGEESDRVFLILFGSGIRGNKGLGEVSASFGLTGLPVSYAGPQGDFDGLDQVNLPLPRTLNVRGEQYVDLRVAGRLANKVVVNIK